MTFPDFSCLTLGQNNFWFNRDTHLRFRPISSVLKNNRMSPQHVSFHNLGVTYFHMCDKYVRIFHTCDRFVCLSHSNESVTRVKNSHVFVTHLKNSNEFFAGVTNTCEFFTRLKLDIYENLKIGRTYISHIPESDVFVRIIHSAWKIRSANIKVQQSTSWYTKALEDISSNFAEANQVYNSR